MTVKIALPADMVEYIEAKAAAKKISVSEYIADLFLRDRRLTPNNKEAKNAKR